MELNFAFGANTEYLLVITIIVYLFYSYSSKPLGFPPGPPRLPLLGNLHQIGSEPHKSFMKMQQKYGNMFSVYLGNLPAVVINEPTLLREAFSKGVFAGRSNFLKSVQDRSGGTPRGLIFTHEKTWTEQRRFAIKTLRNFGMSKKAMESMILVEAQELIETFKRSVGKPITTQHKFNAAALNALWMLVTGKRFSHDDPILFGLLKQLTSAVSSSPVAGAVLFFPFLYKLHELFPFLFGRSITEKTKARKDIVEFIEKQVKEHQDKFDSTESNPKTFIDAYLREMETASKDSSFYGEEGIQNLIYTLFDLFVAGSETTATTLTWMFLLLAMNPEAQKRLQQEIDKVVGNARLPSLEDRPNMPYTEAMTLEVMRRSAMAPSGVFHSTLEDTNFKGYFIPKNTIIISNLYACLRDPKIWGDPENFRPERFLSPDGKSVVRHEALIPFSTGKRVCLGEGLAKDELFLFSVSLFQKFTIAPDPNGPKLTLDCNSGTVLIPNPHELVVFDRYDENANKNK